MEFATGALGTLLPKLAQLLQGEYQLQKNVRKNIEFLKKELETTQAALRSVGEVPTEQLTELVRIWAGEARELSYDMEDIVDAFLVRVEGPDPPSKRSAKRFIHKMRSILLVGKRHQIGEQIRDIKERVVELAARRDRCKVDAVNHMTSVDPRVKALYVKTTELVGIEEARKEIIMNLTKGDDMSSQVQKMVSIVGFGGLGKTILAKSVCDEIGSQFDCTAFVTVSQNPDIKKFFKDMLYELDNQKYKDIHSTSLDVNHLIDLVRGFISNKRYLIIIDDIWDISNWDIIKCALRDDNTGCRIITTTRKVRIAEYIGGAYEMKPLSSYNSRVLLCRRIFGNENLEKCLNKDLAEVSDRILKKCAGVPLAIITIASLLVSKGRNKSEWVDVCNSIGNGMENSLDSKNMRKILSYSYYDLPSHLKTCLLYLSMFPEDFNIGKDRLIRLWIAEGFIQRKEKGISPFEIGESYFNELINRSMVEPVYDSLYNIEIVGCHIHDMVLDIIRSLSSEENFVTLFGNMDKTSTETTIRRLSLQHGKIDDNGSTWCSVRMAQVRSVLVFPSAIDHMSALQSFKILRVLDLEYCNLSKGYNLKYLCNLLHLRYINLKETKIDQFPEDVIGNLQFLETLDLRCSAFSCLPMAVTQMKYLMCLRMYVYTRVLNEIGSLRSLEELSWLRIQEDSRAIVEALGLLTELRVLHVALFTHKWNDKLAELLQNLQKIEDFEITNSCWTHLLNMDGLDTWDTPPHLRSLKILGWCWFSTLPPWLNNNPSHHFQDLSILSISVRELRQKDLLILGRLPSLRNLDLKVDHVELRIYARLVVGAGSFPCLQRCRLFEFVPLVVLEQGAMLMLRILEFGVHVREVRKITGSGGGFDFSLGNLSSLQKVYAFFQYEYASEEEVEEVMTAVRKEAEIHPNRPTLEMYNKGLRVE